jgi:hypothetical protein
VLEKFIKRINDVQPGLTTKVQCTGTSAFYGRDDAKTALA